MPSVSMILSTRDPARAASTLSIQRSEPGQFFFSRRIHRLHRRMLGICSEIIFYHRQASRAKEGFECCVQGIALGGRCQEWRCGLRLTGYRSVPAPADLVFRLRARPSSLRASRLAASSSRFRVGASRKSSLVWPRWGLFCWEGRAGGRSSVQLTPGLDGGSSRKQWNAKPALLGIVGANRLAIRPVHRESAAYAGTAFVNPAVHPRSIQGDAPPFLVPSHDMKAGRKMGGEVGRDIVFWLQDHG